jgi:hypothetical protein
LNLSRGSEPWACGSANSSIVHCDKGRVIGHQRLGDIPKSKKWSAVVASVTGEDTATGGPNSLSQAIPEIADLTLDAAETGLQRAIDDPGLRFTFYLLTQIVLAARESDWQRRLAGLGIHLSDESSIFDLTADVQDAVDQYSASYGVATDVSEMAQQAAGQAIAELAGPDAKTLFGSGAAELQEALRKLSTKAGFARLGQHFFGRFMSRFLNFYLSRVTAGQVGGRRLGDVRELSHFNEALEHHCNQSAQIVHDFCGEWYSKTEFQHGIDLENTSKFMAVALKKLQAEIGSQREGHD